MVNARCLTPDRAVFVFYTDLVSVGPRLATICQRRSTAPRMVLLSESLDRPVLPLPRVRPCSPWFFWLHREEPRGTRGTRADTGNTGGHGEHGRTRADTGETGGVCSEGSTFFDSSRPLKLSRHTKKKNASSTGTITWGQEPNPATGRPFVHRRRTRRSVAGPTYVCRTKSCDRDQPDCPMA